MPAHAVAREPASARAPGRLALWGGRALTALVVLMMVVSALMKITGNAQAVAMFVGTFGYAESALLGIAVLELGCAALYAIPQTAVLGAILLTGYLGGAVATHVRIGDPRRPRHYLSWSPPLPLN